MYEQGGINYAESTIILTKRPTNTVRINVGVIDNTKLKLCKRADFIGNSCTTPVDQLQLNYASNENEQEYIILALDNSIVESSSYTSDVILQVDEQVSDAAWHSINPKTINIEIIDNDEAGATITPPEIIVNENLGSDTFSVVLSAAPTSDVVIDLVSQSTADATISHSSLTFTPLNWNIPQVVTVNGVDDDLDMNETTIVVISVNDAKSYDMFDTLDDQNVAITLLDDDISGLIVDPEEEITLEEGGGSHNFLVSLATEPANEVTLQTISNNTDIEFVTTSLTFTPQNWNIPQTITTNTLADTDNLDDNATIEFDVLDIEGNDPIYTQLASVNRTIKILDITRDGDGDGIQDSVERTSLNLGDGNNDGELDVNQSDVVFLPIRNNNEVIVDGNGCDLTTVSKVEEVELVLQDTEYEYPNGLINFTANCPQAEITLYSTISNSVLRKFSNTYSTIPLTSTELLTIGGVELTAYKYTITDGGLLDSGVAGDGKIIDPIGFGVKVELLSNETLVRSASSIKLIRTGGW